MASGGMSGSPGESADRSEAAEQLLKALGRVQVLEDTGAAGLHLGDLARQRADVDVHPLAGREPANPLHVPAVEQRRVAALAAPGRYEEGAVGAIAPGR